MRAVTLLAFMVTVYGNNNYKHEKCQDMKKNRFIFFIFFFVFVVSV